MELTELFQAELDREVARSRRALEQVPEGKADWKPHEKSMIFGYLTEMVATIPTWITMIIKQDELDIAPKEPRPPRAPKNKSAEYLEALDKAAADARAALKSTNDEYLKTTWRLLAGGQVVMELPRHEMIRDTINHWAHHRGQMTVYLRLMGAKVPALVRSISRRQAVLSSASFRSIRSVQELLTAETAERAEKRPIGSASSACSAVRSSWTARKLGVQEMNPQDRNNS